MEVTATNKIIIPHTNENRIIANPSFNLWLKGEIINTPINEAIESHRKNKRKYQSVKYISAKVNAFANKKHVPDHIIDKCLLDKLKPDNNQ